MVQRLSKTLEFKNKNKIVIAFGKQFLTTFELLGHHLIASFNEAYEANELTISQRRGVITLIPKEEGSLLDLSNYHQRT